VSRDPVFLEGYFAAATRVSANLPASDIVIDTESVSATTAAAAIADTVRPGRRRVPSG
jgi:hypothetical protein